ncbi:MAG: SPOR domain-containing protein [Candidatus Eisenbacteria bacterium]|nr:SPOR domain-containing protein [Candidatus Eisenbacteria bacterium]
MRQIMRPAGASLAVFLIAGVLGCAGLEPRGSGEPVRKTEAEEIDTYVRSPETTAAEKRRSVAFPAEEAEPVLHAVPEDEPLPLPSAPPESASIAVRHVSGYRVQLYATREPEKAKAFAESARAHFREKIYVEYLEPYYKVRVGDCLTREEARLLLDRAKDAGFDEAWVTATLVMRTAGDER